MFNAHEQQLRNKHAKERNGNEQQSEHDGVSSQAIYFFNESGIIREFEFKIYQQKHSPAQTKKLSHSKFNKFIQILLKKQKKKFAQ
jgi:hypothetical protein